jgi:hypothetical protein
MHDNPEPHSFSYSFIPITEPDDCFPAFFKGIGIKDGWYMLAHIVTENVI